MCPVDSPPNDQWKDLLQALDFLEGRFAEWELTGVIEPEQLENIRDQYESELKKWALEWNYNTNVPRDTGLPERNPGESAALQSLRYWNFMKHEIRRLAYERRISLAQSHALLTETRERQAVLERQIAPGEVLPESRPHTSKMESPKKAAPEPSDKTLQVRRGIMEILLDPRSIQMLLAFGASLMVVGLVILLWVNEYFSPPVAAVSLGLVNTALLGLGWFVLRNTRFQLAGRALTLIACLIMPLNLWYYHANQLITLDGHLWLAALVISALYAASALVLRDELFVYVFTAAVTMTGLLVLADLPPSPQKFWEIALPSTLLVVLGVLAIHVERAFPEQEGPFGRQRFGLAFFWSGHALLAAGLLLVLGAEIAGDWLYTPFFESLYRLWNATPSPIVGELRWLAMALVLTGTYAYIYSDLVVRHIGVYVHIAAGTLLWALILGLQLLNIPVGIDAIISVLAVTSLLVNAAQATALRDSRYTNAFPVFGVLLPLLAVGLGVQVFFRALSLDLKSVWSVAPPAWTYVGAMLLTALSCRFGAHVYRGKQPRLVVVYFFATAAATLIGVTAFLAALGLDSWREHAPWLMLIPIIYLVASRLYRDRPEETALIWVSHCATAVMLVSCLASAIEGFAPIQQQPLNLVLALFCTEAAVFYGLATAFHKHVCTIHLFAAMACGAVWQLLTYWGVSIEFYTLTFALVGLGLLVIYRFALLEHLASGPLADAAFQSANTLLSLSFMAALFLGLSRLATDQIRWGLVGLFGILTILSLVAVTLVRHTGWRRWYVVMAIGQLALTFFGVSVLSVLSGWQKLEIFSVTVGMLLLVEGHIGWYREQERQSDLVSLSLFLGSMLVGVPLAVAALIDRGQAHFIFLNELGFLAAGVLLLTSGFIFRIKSTTIVGTMLTVLYFLTLLIFVPWSRLNAVAVFILGMGGTLFVVGLLLSVYREYLVSLPDRIKQRQGLFSVLNWR